VQFTRKTAILNVYASNGRLSDHMKQALTKHNVQIDRFTKIGGDFSTPLSVIDRIG
jgi:hypothetical protein